MVIYRFTLLSLGSVLMLTFALPTVCFGQRGNESSLQRFQRELHKRVSRDQSARKSIGKFSVKNRSGKPGESLSPSKQKRYNNLLQKASETDESNLNWLQEQIAQHGFPTAATLGVKSADEFFLLILHADRDREFQKRCLQSIRQAKEGWPPKYAQLLEIRINQPGPPVIKLSKDSPQVVKQIRAEKEQAGDNEESGMAEANANNHSLVHDPRFNSSGTARFLNSGHGFLSLHSGRICFR